MGQDFESSGPYDLENVSVINSSRGVSGPPLNGR